MTDQFSYLSVLLSIVLGLAITQVLKGFRGILLTRVRVRMYFPSVLWAFLLLVLFVQSWWAMFSMHLIPEWSFPTFFVVVLQTVLSYMLAAIVFPDFFGENLVDLRSHYFEHARWFFGLMVALLFISLLKGLVVFGGLPGPLDLGFHIIFIVVSAIAALWANDIYHKSMAVISAGLIAAYILLLFMRLH